MTELKEGYKDTEIGVIPVEWEAIELGDIATFSKGKGISKKDISEDGVECIRYGELFTTYNEIIRTIKSKTNSTTNMMYSKVNDTLMPTSDVTPNGLATASALNKEGVILGGDILIIRSNDILNSYLSYFIRSHKKQIMKLVSGSTVYHIYANDMKKLKIPLPPLKEQAKIADILSTADEKIDATQGQIQKAETLKKGLLQKLLSEGIGHSEFKDSELGKIPESWEVVELAKITTILLSNVDKKSKEDEQNVKLCNYMDVYNNQYITNDLVYMEATAKDNQIEKFQLQINDVIITKDSETKGDIAIPAVVKETFENLICGYHLAVLRPKENILYGVYLMKAIQSVNVHKHFEKLANGITRFGLTSSAINQALIPLPPIEEQNEIANILSSVDNKLVVLRAKKEKYKTLKKGLLQKLLSGEIRTKESKNEL